MRYWLSQKPKMFFVSVMRSGYEQVKIKGYSLSISGYPQKFIVHHPLEYLNDCGKGYTVSEQSTGVRIPCRGYHKKEAIKSAINILMTKSKKWFAFQIKRHLKKYGKMKISASSRKNEIIQRR